MRPLAGRGARRFLRGALRWRRNGCRSADDGRGPQRKQSVQKRQTLSRDAGEGILGYGIPGELLEEPIEGRVGGLLVLLEFEG